MKFKFLILILIIALPLILSGCWDYFEYENMAQIVGIGFDFDRDSDEITVTTQYLPTTTGSKGQQQTSSSKPPSSMVQITHAATDNDIFDALSNLQQSISKRLFYGYLRVIVVGEDMAKYNLRDLIEYLDRTPSIRATAYFVVTPGKAENVLSTVNSSYSNSSSRKIYNLVNQSILTGTSYPISIQDFTQMLAIGGLEAVAPRINSTVQIPQKPIAQGGTQENVRFDEQIPGDVRLDGIAVFNKDKFVGWLESKETIGYGWITGKRMENYEVHETSDVTDKEHILYFRITNSSRKLKVEINNGKPVILLNVKATADLRKYDGPEGAEFLAPQEIYKLEQKLSDSIRFDIQAALQKCQQEYKSDIFGFGFALFRKDPYLWKTQYESRWFEIFPDISVNVNVEANVMNTGVNIKKLTIR